MSPEIFWPASPPPPSSAAEKPPAFYYKVIPFNKLEHSLRLFLNQTSRNGGMVEEIQHTGRPVNPTSQLRISMGFTHSIDHNEWWTKCRTLL